MPSILVTAEVNPANLLKALEGLPAKDLEQIYDGVARLRAQKRSDSLTEPESELIRVINEGLAESEWRRFKELIGKREQETLLPVELEELERVTDKAERLHTRRMEALLDLAQLRGSSLDEVMAALGIGPQSHE